MAADPQHERGAVTVETALVSIFLLILVTGMIDLGRAIFNDISIQEAAQEGAFYGAFEENATVADIKSRAAASTSSPALAPDEVTVACSPAAKSKMNGTRVEVTVTHQLDLVTPLVGDWLGGSLTLQKKAESERFYATCPSS